MLATSDSWYIISLSSVLVVKTVAIFVPKWLGVSCAKSENYNYNCSGKIPYGREKIFWNWRFSANGNFYILQGVEIGNRNKWPYLVLHALCLVALQGTGWSDKCCGYRFLSCL